MSLSLNAIHAVHLCFYTFKALRRLYCWHQVKRWILTLIKRQTTPFIWWRRFIRGNTNCAVLGVCVCVGGGVLTWLAGSWSSAIKGKQCRNVQAPVSLFPVSTEFKSRWKMLLWQSQALGSQLKVGLACKNSQSISHSVTQSITPSDTQSLNLSLHQ